MALTIDARSDTFTVIVTFTPALSCRQELVEAIRAFVENVVRHQPGFLSSTVHVSADGARVINYAQWASRQAYEAFGANDAVMDQRGTITDFPHEGQPYEIAFQVTASA
ncbi:putative quinol monooxygenase [Streptomyces echinatus]|uniref:Quinol monooxygenase YgiN n=1 Tax=Streptomyces echinatus TaxID=67293 RepID=A0A7W9Q4L5_9ACTN|nr:antibiotic biosynthesis monooxygenase family protein [Streptomyces echinatus]MBB5932712.1 quinol monooxygenase YgiN [Streptomyces echinatus]